MFIPSLLVTQVYYPYSEEKNTTAKILQKVAEDGFYEAIEIDCHYEEEERKRIAELVKENGWMVTQWLTSLIDKEQLDLSSLNETVRNNSVEVITRMFSKAQNMGVHNVAFISGPSPGDDLRQEALEKFYKSLVEICRQAEMYELNVLIEPLDYQAHKRKALGTTDETIELIKRVREEFSNIYFAFDTAHAALNDENLSQSVVKALPWMDQIHLSNAVLDSNHDLYGDHHMAVGEPGFLNAEVIREILQLIEKNKQDENHKLRVSVEVKGSNSQELHESEAIIRKVLTSGIDFTREGKKCGSDR